MFGTSPNKHVYAHLNTVEEVEAEMNKITAEIEKADKVQGMAGIARNMILKFKTEQLGWRYGELTGNHFMEGW